MVSRALDGARGALLHRVARVPWLGRVVRHRDARVTARIIAASIFALTLAIAAPAATLAVSPLLLGVPHVASSTRYLVLRQRLPRAWLGVLLAGALLLMIFRIAEQYGRDARLFARLEVACGFGLGIAAALFAGRGRRAFIAVALIATAGVFGIANPTATRLLFVHVHNLGAIAVWALFLRRRRMIAPLVGVGVALIACALSTPLYSSGLGVDLAVVGTWLAPGLSASLATSLVLTHVFTDSMHYAFWLGVIPEETLRQEGTLTFRMTWRAWRRDFGTIGLALVAVVWLAFLAFAIFGPARARDAYFAIAGFHGYLEGAMLVYLMVVSSNPHQRPTHSDAAECR